LNRPRLPGAKQYRSIAGMTSKSICRLAGMLMALGAAACTAGPETAPPAAASETLWPAVKAEVGDAACDSAAQCRSMPVGSKACGGPAGYLAWSTKRSSEPRLKALVERHAQAQRDEDARAGAASNCMMVMDPGASCVTAGPNAGRCTLNTGRTGAP
jgi:hypothetical protein